MTLTRAEKEAGRAFRNQQRAALAAMPTAAACSPYIREYRHACPRNGGISTAIRLREHYELSPAYRLHATGWLAEFGGMTPGPSARGGSAEVPAGLFAFIWLDGSCACGFRVRSSGRLELAADRPPERRTARA